LLSGNGNQQALSQAEKKKKKHTPHEPNQFIKSKLIKVSLYLLVDGYDNITLISLGVSSATSSLVFSSLARASSVAAGASSEVTSGDLDLSSTAFSK